MNQQKYLCILRSETGSCEEAMPSDMTQEMMQAMMSEFETWQTRFKSNIVNLGGKLSNGGKVFSPTGVTDGPFIESKEIVGGFMILAAENLEEAVHVAQACPPIAASSANVEIREIMAPPGG